MILLLDEQDAISARRVRLVDRVLARLRAPRLDRALADGAAPDRDLPLALHSERLVRTSQRRLLARSLRRLVAAADSTRKVSYRVPLDRGRIHENRVQLEALANRLLASGPVGVRGVAMIRTLVADGTGPLYDSASARDLHAELHAAIAAIDLLA